MKLITAIVNHDDSSAVLKNLVKEGFQATKLATTGGFLLAGNTTFLIGVEDEKVDQALAIIEAHSKKRTQMVPPMGTGLDGAILVMPVEVTVGGATCFVTNVEQFAKF